MVSDESLIARVITQRDQHAFGQLVLRYQSPLRRWARRFCRGDEQAADDLAQETFIKAYRAMPNYRGQARFSTWLYRIAFNLAASQRRLARERWQQVEFPYEDQAPMQTDAQMDLEAAMARLSEPQQLAIRLSLEEGMTHEEVAEVMAIPLGTVKTHILRGKQTLKGLLASWREERP